ncbi:MAG TPA: nucleotidyltransferase [Candidatus Moranbacteria bacterium]|nr:nucleotidyltransferase [Candidatus Moranbacteria bacterium]HAT74609.1 nucleotidyltransferase [Candidatus Moranbacteria bacterium]
MAYLEEKIEQLEQALIAWKKAQDAPQNDLNRDAAIQRYEFSFELFWKTVKIYLKEIEGIECASPKSCFREVRNILDLSEKEIEVCLGMAEDRNLSVHTYSEKMAIKLYEKFPKYLKTAEKILGEIKSKIK